MASLTRSQLKTSSNTTYDTNGVGGITAAEVRTFNDDLIDSLITNDLTGGMSVLSASFALTASSVASGVLTPLNQFTASATIRLNNLETTSASVNISIANLNGATGSYAISSSVAAVDAAQQQQINSLIAASSSYANSASFAASQLVQDGRLNNLETTSASLLIETSNLETFSASALISINALNTNSASVNTSITNINSATQSLQAQLNTIGGQTGSYITESETGSFAITGSNIFRGNQTITGSLLVSGSDINFRVVGNSVINPSFDLSTINASIAATDINMTVQGDVKINNNVSGRGLQLSGGDPVIGLRDTSAPNNPFIALTNRNNRLEIIDSTSTIATMNTASFNIPSASFTASLQQGYVWVGDSTGKTITVATSSFGGALPNNLISSSAQISALGFVSSSVTASSLITASLSGQTLTFTKGNGTTFGIVLPDVSGSDISALNAFTASQLLINTGYNTFTSSTNTSISALNQFTASQSTASLVTSITELNTFSASAKISIFALNSATASYVTETESGSFLLTASFDNGNRNLTFTKGDNTTFAVNIPDVSGSAGTFVTTASFNAYTQSNDQRVSSLETNSASVNISINNINTTTASLNTSVTNLNASSASQQISIDNLNTNSASVNTSITNLNSATASLFTSASLALTTASVSGQNIIFRKGDGTTFNILIPTASYFTSSISVSGSITISGSIENVDYIDFNTASAVPTWKSGRVFWDNTDGCLGVYNAEADVTLQVGQEMWVRARNNTGVTIANGAAVRLVGALGDNPLIVLAQSVQVSGSAITDNQILGLATHTIETGTDGYVTTLGNVRGLNTSAFAQGDVLFVSSSAGLLTNVIPVAPYERIPVATVVKVGPGGSGILYVAPQPPIDFSDLSSVLIEGDYATDDVWIYESNVWKHKSKSDIGLTTTASFNAYTSSTNGRLTNIESTTASLNSSVTQLNASSASQQISIDNLNAATGSYATTGSNTFTGNQLINKNGGEYQLIDPTNPQYGTTSIGISGASGGLIFKQSGSVLIEGQAGQTGLVFYGTGSFNRGIALSDSDFVAGATIRYDTTNDVVIIEKDGLFKPALNIEGTLTASLEQGYVWVGNASGRTTTVATSSFGGGGSIDTGSLMVTGSVAGNVLTFTKGDATTFSLTVDTGSGGGTIDTGSFATTGSNNFTGQQTLTDAGFVNQITLDDYSGSLVLFAKGYTSSSLAHISGSNASISASVGNLIFKTSNTTPDTILTGSQNIFANPFTATAGFKRYIGGNANIFLGAASVPQISGSMGFSPTMNLNTGGGAYTFRGPVSSSAWTLSSNLNLGTINIGSSAAFNAEKLVSGLTLSSNTIQGTVTINANSAFLTGSTTSFSNNSVAGVVTLSLNSSAASLANNIINDSGFTLTNQFYSSSLGLGSVPMNRNNIGGQNNSIIISGSLPAGGVASNSISDNFIFGGANTIYIDVANARVSGSAVYKNVIRTGLMGNNLIVSGSSLLADASSYGSVFVGRYNANDNIRNKTSDVVFAVGTGNTTTRKTGFLIDSGSNSFFEGAVSISGSLLLNGSSVAGIATGSFATTGSNSFNGNQTITGSLIVSGAFETTQDITIQDASGNPTLKIGRGAGNQPSNLRFGVQALATTGVGLNNIAIGNSAMQYSSQSFATENISIGGESLQYTQEGQQIAIGTSALRYTTTGKENLAIGAFAMQNNITGSQNLAIGFNSLYNHTDGTKNIAIGPSAAQNFSSGSNNIFIGYQTANSISGSNNVILGAYNGTGETINNNIILADGAGNKELQFSGSTWTTENNFVVSGSLSAANNIKMGRGVDKPTNKVTVGSGGLIVSNSLVTSDSYIFATNDTTVGNYSPVVSNITAGSFSLSNGGYGGNISVMYMIVNPY